MTLRRRSFITLLGGAAAAWPLAAGAQQPAMPVVGYLYAGAPGLTGNYLAAFQKGLSETGYVEGRNVAIEYRFGQNDNDRLPELVADLVRRRVAVIAVPGSIASAIAAKSASTTIPVVFATGADPVQAGLVPSLNRPSGNVTGIVSVGLELSAKRLGILNELIAGATRFAVLINPSNPSIAEPFLKEMQAASAAIGRRVEVFSATTNAEIDTAFAALVQRRPDGLAVAPDLLFNNRRVQLVSLSTRHGVPTIYSIREFADIGGLMSYGSNFTDLFRQAGIYTGRILKGEKPADLPVMQPTKFELVINLQTAKLLGVAIPATLLALADEVIE